MSSDQVNRLETIADIVAEMRREVGYGKDTYCGKRVIRLMEDVRVMQFCDRIDAAWKRDEERAVEHATRHAEAVARDNYIHLYYIELIDWLLAPAAERKGERR